MKAGAKNNKGQRSIQSFLFKPKALPNAAKEIPNKRVLGEKQAVESSDIIPSNKKPRLSQDTGHLDAVKCHNLSARTANDPESSQNGSLNANRDPVPHKPAPTASIQLNPAPVPARNQHTHQRFQQKLVVGAGNRADRNAKALSSITKPKYTPLELQIVELKEKHPGVLLIVEVCSHCSICSVAK